MSHKRIWTNCRVLTGATSTKTDTVDIAVKDGRIVAVGPALAQADAEIVECDSRLVTPAFIDCHTHLVHGGDRALEFEMRLQGADYQEIARAGGGIAATMRDTRRLSVDALVEASLPRLDRLLSEGVATVEVKSGYGLEVVTELNMLRAARRLETLRPVRITTTWLAAHSLPPEYQGRKADYIRDVALAGLDQAHGEGLVDAVDGFCEGIAFSPAELEPLFQRARHLGLPVKLHAEQLSHSNGTQLATKYHALSVDHLEYATRDDVAAMKSAGSVAVLLPGAFYTLRETQVPPISTLRDFGVPMALATDCNPGTSPLTSLILTMNMAATLFRMTVRECLDGVTIHAAKALGLGNEIGRIAPGYSADLAVWDADSAAQLVNRLGFNPLHSRVLRGVTYDG